MLTGSIRKFVLPRTISLGNFHLEIMEENQYRRLNRVLRREAYLKRYKGLADQMIHHREDFQNQHFPPSRL